MQRNNGPLRVWVIECRSRELKWRLHEEYTSTWGLRIPAYRHKKDMLKELAKLRSPEDRETQEAMQKYQVRYRGVCRYLAARKQL